MENTIFLPSQSITLSWKSPQSEYAHARKLILVSSDGTSDFIFDERVNDLFLTHPRASNKKTNFIYEKFHQLIDSDFKYKFGDGYEGQSLKLETFIDFLKKEDRESQINKIFDKC